MFLNRFLWVSILPGVLLVLLVFINTAQATLENMEALGKALYFDTNLSMHRTQSCATCHMPERGFVDARDNGIAAMVSLGDDGKSLGDRHTPSAAYAAFSPPFHKNKKGDYIGGQFHDGRARDLAEQAAGPPLNPIEMGMPGKQAVVERLRENQAYVSAFKRLFGEAILHDPEQA